MGLPRRKQKPASDYPVEVTMTFAWACDCPGKPDHKPTCTAVILTNDLFGLYHVMAKRAATIKKHSTMNIKIRAEGKYRSPADQPGGEQNDDGSQE